MGHFVTPQARTWDTDAKILDVLGNTEWLGMLVAC